MNLPLNQVIADPLFEFARHAAGRGAIRRSCRAGSQVRGHNLRRQTRAERSTGRLSFAVVDTSQQLDVQPLTPAPHELPKKEAAHGASRIVTVARDYPWLVRAGPRFPTIQ